MRCTDITARSFPTTAEGGMKDFTVSGWYGLVAPGSQAIGAGPEQLDAHFRREMARWDKVLKTAGIQLK